MLRLGDITALLAEWYDPARAESWDAVGLVCGDPDERVQRVLLAVDAVPATVAEACAQPATLLLTHHPLLLTGVHGVPADDPKGGLVHRMIRAGTAHYVAHTNADVANPGVSDALAVRIGLSDLSPLDPQHEAALEKLVVFVPLPQVEQVIDALAAAGAGEIGNYERCAWMADGTGTFRPLPGAAPAIGQVGTVEWVAETRVEMVVPAARRGEVINALRGAHPYEEPAFDLLATAPSTGDSGTGRVGLLPERLPLRAFVDHVAAALPATRWGVRAAGDPDKAVRTVAVCGGSGGSLTENARRAGADAFLTSDLRHHPAVEAVTERGAGAMALVDAAHWATEAPWLDAVATRLREHLGTTVEVAVSRERTDPWTLHASAPTTGSP